MELTDLLGKQLLIVQLILHPAHQRLYIERGGQGGRFLIGDPVFPEEFILGPCVHYRALPGPRWEDEKEDRSISLDVDDNVRTGMGCCLKEMVDGGLTRVGLQNSVTVP